MIFYSLKNESLEYPEIIPVMMEALREESLEHYEAYMLANVPPTHAKEDPHSLWWVEQAPSVFHNLFDILSQSAEEIPFRRFGLHPQDGKTLGFWPDFAKIEGAIETGKAWKILESFQPSEISPKIPYVFVFRQPNILSLYSRNDLGDFQKLWTYDPKEAFNG
jgi:hypothetical protein